MLAIKSLSHSFSEGLQIQYPDWEIKKNEHAVILGNSGSGKTTLLHAIGGLLKPTKGSISIDGSDLSAMSTSRLDTFRGEHIGIVFQKPHLINSLSVFENLILSQYLGGKKANKQEVLTVMEQLNILELKGRKVHQVSQGQAQRISIGRAILNKPKLVLADEPTASLDDENCEKVIKLLIGQAELHDSTLVVATHDHRIKGELQNTLEL